MNTNRLKEEVRRLATEHADALNWSVYTGMTPDEAEAHHDRLTKIKQLVEQLLQLEPSE